MGILHQTVFIRTELLRAINPFATAYVTWKNYLMMALCLNRIMPANSRRSLVAYREGGWSLHEYGGANFSRTVDDLGRYFYDSAGYFWGVSMDQCRSMRTWICFAELGIGYS